jgi:hypothetical protein
VVWGILIHDDFANASVCGNGRTQSDCHAAERENVNHSAIAGGGLNCGLRSGASEISILKRWVSAMCGGALPADKRLLRP